MSQIGVRDFLHTVGDADVGEELIQLVLDRGVGFSPTLTNIQAGWNFVEHPELLENPEIRAAFEPEAFARWNDPAVREQALVDPGLASRRARFARAPWGSSKRCRMLLSQWLWAPIVGRRAGTCQWVGGRTANCSYLSKPG